MSRKPRIDQILNNVSLIYFFSGLLFIISLWGLDRSQYIAKFPPSSLWLGIIFLVISLDLLCWGLSLFFENKQKGNSDDVQGTVFILLVISVILTAVVGITLLAAPASGLSRFVLTPFKPYASKSDLSANISIEPKTVHSGGRVVITVNLENPSTAQIGYKKVTLALPKHFFEGTVLNYPLGQSVIKTCTGSLCILLSYFRVSPYIVFEGGTLEPGEAISYQIVVVAIYPGDYSGDYLIVVPMSNTSDYRGEFGHSEEINFFVIP